MDKFIPWQGPFNNVYSKQSLLQATKDASNFYPTWDLAEVTTEINLIALVCHITGKNLSAAPEVVTKIATILNGNLIAIIVSEH